MGGVPLHGWRAALTGSVTAGHGGRAVPPFEASTTTSLDRPPPKQGARCSDEGCENDDDAGHDACTSETPARARTPRRA